MPKLASRLLLCTLALPLVGVPLLSIGCGSDFNVKVSRAQLMASPGFLDFGTLPVGARGDSAVTLNAVDGDVQVLGMQLVNVEGDFLDIDNSVLPLIPNQASAEVPVRYLPTQEGFHWGELRIVTDEKDNPEHVVQVRGQAQANLVRAYPAILDFGAVRPGDSAQRALTLVNEGQTDLTVQALASDNGVFSSASALPVALGAGERVAVILEFDPTDADAARGSLDIQFAEFAGLDPVAMRGNDCATAGGSLYDVDGDGFGYCGGDCNDWDPTIHPGASEVCDGLDQDCDGILDNGTECYDDDGDGYAENDNDCNDGDPAVSPVLDELYGNGIDDNCDGIVDDGSIDSDGDGYTTEAGDCDDTDPSAGPGMPELPNRVDDDCDGVVDEGTVMYDDDGDGYTEMDGDCDDTDPSVHPGTTETANWIDDNCDGVTDEGTIYGDDDGDGFSEVGGDCDDADATVSPGMPEVTGDGKDNNCDGVTE